MPPSPPPSLGPWPRRIGPRGREGRPGTGLVLELGRGVEERPHVDRSRSGALEVLLLRLSSGVARVERFSSCAVAGGISGAPGAWEGAGGEALPDLG